MLGTRDRYYTFCTPECYEAVQEYLEFRKRCGEDLKDKSPLFRKHFNKNDPFTINVPHFLSEAAVMRLIDEALKKAGVKTSDAMRSHAFRKGFKSICERSGMKSINIEVLMGHNIGVSGHYYRPAESGMLEDYMTHAADILTISSEHRFKKRNEELETGTAQKNTEQDQEIAKMKERLDLTERKASGFEDLATQVLDMIGEDLKLQGTVEEAAETDERSRRKWRQLISAANYERRKYKKND